MRPEQGDRLAAGAERAQDSGLRFARSLYLPRVLGLGFGTVCVGSVLWQDGAHALVFAVLAANGFVWPHVAYGLARRSANPYRAERRNLAVDSTLGGVWVALMAFNLLPSVLLMVMLAMDKLIIGGPKFLARCLALQVAAIALTALATGVPFRPETSLIILVACLPLLVGYPIVVGYMTYRLARRVRDQKRLLAELSRTDGLTRLLNRRAWEEIVGGEFERVRRIGHASALLMIDIDHFKPINDRFGHPAGDEVIVAVATLLRDTTRRHDIIGRYGGEEFGIVLPGADAAGAQVIAERVRERIATAVLAPDSAVRATVSIGIAVLAPGDGDYKAWIGRADRALYEAKARGRNCVALDQPS